MSKLDQKYIDNLQKFSDALENIVQLLQEQNKKGGEAGSTDSVNTMLGGLDTEKITKIVNDLEQINSRTKTVESNTEKILTEVRNARKAKEAGIFDKIEDGKNKKKIVDGVKTVVLIAGAVMAMGAAFKIVGKVNFLSVIGLSIAMVLLAKAFSEIASIKDLTYKKALLAGAILVGMSGALLASAYILTAMPTLNVMQMLTIGAIGVSIGIATWGIMSALKKFEPKDMWVVGIIPTLIPAIAGGVLVSALIFKQIQPLSTTQMLGAIMVGLALIPISFAFSLMVKGMKGVDWKSMLFAATAVPIMAATVYGASLLFQKVQPLNNFFDIITTSLAIGLSVLFLVPAFILIAKSKIDIKGLALGTLAIVAVSTAIMASSWILSVGNYGKYPSIEWSAGVGLSLLSFVPSVIVLGLLATTGIGIPAILLGSVATLAIAGVIVGVSHILGKGNFSAYPSVEWTAGVGLSMLAFMIPMIALGTLIMGTLGIGALILLAGGGAIASIAGLMVNLSNKFSDASFDKYPSQNWVNGVSSALYLFTDNISNMNFSLRDFLKIKLIANAVVGIAEIFNKNSSLFSQPNAMWLKNLKDVINIFNDLPDSSKANGLNSILNSLNRLSVMGIANISPILLLSTAIKKLSSSLDNLNLESVDKLLKLSGGVMILSLIDQAKLNEVLETLDDKRKEISVIFDDKSSPLVDAIMSAKNSANMGGSPAIKGANVVTPTETTKKDTEQLEVLKDISSKLDKIANKLEKVERAANVSN
jgi:hypothetical protein